MNTGWLIMIIPRPAYIHISEQIFHLGKRELKGGKAQLVILHRVYAQIITPISVRRPLIDKTFRASPVSIIRRPAPRQRSACAKGTDSGNRAIAEIRNRNTLNSADSPNIPVMKSIAICSNIQQ